MQYNRNMSQMEKLDGQRGFPMLLLYLLKNKKSNVREMTVIVDISQTAVYNALEKMEVIGLVEMKEEWGKRKRGWKRKNYYLTEKGKKVAKKLKEIEGIVEA